jgi:hypothetical protein
LLLYLWWTRSIILNVDTRWHLITQYLFNRRFDVPQGESGSFEEEKYLIILPGIKIRILGRLALNLVSIPTETSQLPIIKEMGFLGCDITWLETVSGLWKFAERSQISPKYLQQKLNVT